MSDIEKKHQIYHAQDYTTQIIKKGDQFTFVVPELGLFYRDTSLEQGFQAVEKKKVEYLQNMYGQGLNAEVVSPGSSFVEKSPSLKLYMIKLFIFFVIFISSSLFVISRLDQMLSAQRLQLQNVFMQDSWMSGSSPKDQDKKLSKFKQKLEELKPYILEIKKVLNEPVQK